MNVQGEVIRAEDPASRLAIELVADKWAIQILAQLRLDVHRYGQLQRALPGVSQRMLTHTLRRLELYGLVGRKVFEETPPHTEYSLTPLGEGLSNQLRGLCQWVHEHFAELSAVPVERK